MQHEPAIGEARLRAGAGSRIPLPCARKIRPLSHPHVDAVPVVQLPVYMQRPRARLYVGGMRRRRHHRERAWHGVGLTVGRGRRVVSVCEKCWSDAHSGFPYCFVTDAYVRLIKEREGNPCTPEEQAGPYAKRCGACDRRTLHQYTSECMTPGCAGGEG